MTIAIPDFTQRREALDPQRSFIVQAPAGSGKTELLIQRYLKLLSTVDHAEEIVAVTFTKKAAGEMRERVLQALLHAQSGRVGETPHEQLTLQLASAALARDSEAGWNLAGNPARLRIQTIDALCAGLTRQMPVLSRFGAQPESVEDALPLYREAAQATLALIDDEAEVADDVERLLLHLDNNVARIEELIAGMLAQRDQWLRHVHGREREELEGALRQARQLALQRLHDALPAGIEAELHSVATYVFANLGHGEFANDDAEDWAVLASAFLTNDDDWRKRLTKDQGFPAGKEAQPWKARALALFAQFDTSPDAREALAAMRELPPERYSDSQWRALGAILNLLPYAVAQLKLIFQSRRQVDFTEVAQGALQALGTDDEPTDLTLALDYRVRHLLIDEFQDTSISQYELVARLTAGWTADDGRTVFAVGDPMQSIYRFREAEVGLFLRARAEGIRDLQLHPVALSSNFRSQAGIVDWVNSAFAQVMPVRENMSSGAVPYTPSVATRDALSGPAVSVHALFGDDGTEEAREIAELVATAQRENPDARVAILVRTRGHLQHIVPQLKAAGLRFRAIDIEPLGQRPVVQDLLALTRTLAHPGDRTAWLALLRAPWCGLTLADLHALAHDDDITLWDALHDDTRLVALSGDGRTRALRLRAVLTTGMLQRARKPLREQVAGAWYALGGPACVAQPTDLEDAEAFFRHLDRHEEAGVLPDRLAFEEGLTQLYAAPDLGADERLQIMTIHKAKGLEFDVVILPGLGRTPRGDEQKLLLWAEQPAAHGAEALLLAPIHASEDDSDPIYTWIRRHHAHRQHLEDGRLLYVAATRARRRLHLFGNVRVKHDDDGAPVMTPPASRSLLGKLWPAVAPAFDAELHANDPQPAPPAPTTIIDQTLRRLPTGWVLPAAPPSAQWQAPPEAVRVQDALEFSWAGETARHVGTVVHRWLQRIAEDGAAGWDEKRIGALAPAIRSALSAEGVGDAELHDAEQRATAALVRCISDERGRWLLGARDAARTEWRLTGVSGGRIINVVLDRSFVDQEGVRWIVDYKTSVHEGSDREAFLDNERERYRGQLEQYARLLRAADDRPIKLGLYFPLLGGWREWDYAA